MLGKLLANAAIERRDQAHLMPGPRQEFGQRPHHVGQSAGFGVRMDLAAREQNSHYCGAPMSIAFQDTAATPAGMSTLPSAC